MKAHACTLEDARAVKDKAAELLAAFPVVGIGITRIGEGYGIKVNLREAAEGLPERLDGVPIRAEIIGKIAKQQSSNP